MRRGIYAMFPVLAGPALLVALFEIGARVMTGSFDGVYQAGLIAVCAAGSLAACKWRLEALPAVASKTGRD